VDPASVLVPANQGVFLRVERRTPVA